VICRERAQKPQKVKGWGELPILQKETKKTKTQAKAFNRE
jgi:hypothetical protein